MKKVTKHTRSKDNGTTIYTPCCKEPKKVYHFSWSALVCNTCGNDIYKLNFLIDG